MCGRYTLTRHDKIVEDIDASFPGDVPVPSRPAEPADSPHRASRRATASLELSESQAAADPWWKPRFNVAPTQPAPVVIRHRSPDRAIAMMRWGLVPHWAGHDGKKAPLMINARLESLNAKQMFRDALAHKRCLVPADGFFEWVARGGRGKAPPQPFYFHPRAGALIAFAGLWARTRDDRDQELRSFTIITTRANELVRPIHDRMPIVLSPDDYAAWLDPELPPERARALLDAPAAQGDWMREAVSTWVNKADHDDPQCLAPAPPELF